VDFEHGLRAVVWRLRTALGDTADEPKWIETVPRKGYRYIGPTPEWVSAPGTTARWRPSYRRSAAILAVAAVAVIGIALGLAGPRSSRAVVAVLSADNLTGEPGLTSLCETMTEELISRLGQVDPGRLGVVARSESRQFRNVTQLTYALRVDFVVEASLVRQAGRLRLNVRLVRIGDRTQVWGSSFDVGTEAPTMASSEVAQSVSESVQEALGLMDRR
jgi:TolB-like protein